MGLAALGASPTSDISHGVVRSGTPEYMAPETFSEKYGIEADIWSFGLCVLELDTHEHPYKECASIAHVFKKVTGVRFRSGPPPSEGVSPSPASP